MIFNCIWHTVRELVSLRENAMEVSNSLVCSRNELDILSQVVYALADLVCLALLYIFVRLFNNRGSSSLLF